MRILYDGLIYSSQSTGGINRYFNNIISRLPSHWTPSLAVRSCDNIRYPCHPRFRLLRHRPLRVFPKTRVFYWLDKYYFQPFRLRTHPHIFHPTYYYLLNHQQLDAYKCPIVLTVWDMINEIFSEQLDPTGHYARMKKKALFSAQALICISENTKKDLLERYALPEDTISVIHLASEIDESYSYGPELIPDAPYYLYVGSRAPYKNFQGALKALAKAVSVRSDVRLCVVGRPFSREEEILIHSLKLDSSILHYGLSDDRHLAKLYRNSLALIYPSFYEGFGIPPLEAMSCGTVVVASHSSSLPEVVGDGGILFDPRRHDDLADILLFLLDNPSKRDHFIAKGKQQAQKFSWEHTVSQTLDVYQSLIKRQEAVNATLTKHK